MNNLFDPNSPLGASFNNIFGQGASAKPQDPPAASAVNSNPPTQK